MCSVEDKRIITPYQNLILKIVEYLARLQILILLRLNVSQFTRFLPECLRYKNSTLFEPAKQPDPYNWLG